MVQNINGHVVRCGDIYDDLDELFEGQKVDIMYSDPPWGEGNLKFWQTMNHKMTGAEKKEVDLNSFINRVCDVAANYVKKGGLVFIEYGCKWNDSFIEVAGQHGLKLAGKTEMLYGNPKRPLMLNIFTNGDSDFVASKEYLDGIYHKHGFASLEAALGPVAEKGMKILDPCCGLGYTAKFAVKHGLTFYGNELNAKRLESTIERLK